MFRKKMEIKNHIKKVDDLYAAFDCVSNKLSNISDDLEVLGEKICDLNCDIEGQVATLLLEEDRLKNLAGKNALILSKVQNLMGD